MLFRKNEVIWVIKLSSLNISNLKKLLDEMWNIFRIDISFTKEKKELKVEVFLERGKEKKHITAVNDAAFTDYIAHFKKFQDEYGNNVFVYVEDLDNYNKEIDKLLQEGNVPNRPYKISIGDLELNGTQLYHLVIAGPGKQIGKAHFFINLRENPDYCNIDLRDRVEIKWTDTGEVVFGGFVHHASHSKDSAVFLCYGGPRRLHEGKITSEHIGIEPMDMVYFIMKSSGMKAHFHGGIGPNLNIRDFKIIFPIEGLQTPCDFRVENVLFNCNIQDELSNQAKIGKTLKKIPWSSATTFAIVVLKASHFYEALFNAEKYAQRAVDWIQIRTDITIPCIPENGKVKKINYNMRKSFSRFSLSRHGLVIDLTTGAALYFPLDEKVGHPLIFKYDPEEFLGPIASIWNKLEQLAQKKESEVQAVYQTINWLMLSYEKESPIDNLLQLWIAFEFICSKQKVPKLVKKQNRKFALTSIENLDIPQEEKDKILNAINNVNNPSLMMKWDYLLKKLGVTLPKKEEELISKLRYIRNKIIHGYRAIDISIEQIEKFRSILERILLLKVSNL
jgi:hypothetical protein